MTLSFILAWTLGVLGIVLSGLVISGILKPEALLNTVGFIVEQLLLIGLALILGSQGATAENYWLFSIAAIPAAVAAYRFIFFKEVFYQHKDSPK